VLSVAFSPDGKHIVSGSYDNTVRVWDAESGQAIGEPLQGHSNSVLSVAFSPDGKHIVSGSYDNTVRVWDAESGQAIGEPLQGHSDSVYSVAFSPDGKHIVSGSEDNTVRVWDAESGQAIGEPLQGHSGSVLSVPFLPDGQHIVFNPHNNTSQVQNAKFDEICVFGFSDGSVPHFDGWITTADGQLLFWIPPFSQCGLLWPRNTVIIGTKNIQLDCHRFAHGAKWTHCRKC
jgi:WD40 repeat protein